MNLHDHPIFFIQDQQFDEPIRCVITLKPEFEGRDKLPTWQKAGFSCLVMEWDSLGLAIFVSVAETLYVSWNHIDELYCVAPKKPEWYYVKDVAAMLSVTQQTVRKWIKQGKIEIVRHGQKGRIRVTTPSIEKLLQEKGLL